MDKKIKKIEDKMRELYILLCKSDLYGWTKKFEVGELEKDKGIYMDFSYGEFSGKCGCCNQPIIEDGLVDLFTIEKTIRSNSHKANNMSEDKNG